MTDLIIAIVGAVGAVVGALVSTLSAAAKNKMEATGSHRRCRPTTNAYGNGTGNSSTTSTAAPHHHRRNHLKTFSTTRTEPT